MLTKTACLWHRELKQELCNNLEGWGGEGDEREVQEGGGHMYTYGWFMLMFGRNQQNSVKQLSFNKKKKFRKKIHCPSALIMKGKGTDQKNVHVKNKD